MNCNFSLDNYEQYRTVTIRPRVMALGTEDLERGRADLLAWTWRELEPERGRYQLSAMLLAIRQAAHPVLLLRPEPPDWATANTAACYAALIRKVASILDGREAVAGVVILAPEDSREVWDAYADAFTIIPVLADIHQPAVIRHWRQRGLDFGLFIRCSEDNRLGCCEAMARARLHHVWKRQPVVLDITNTTCSQALLRDIRRWHVSLANLPLGLGSRLELRRLTYPEQVASGGTLPLRLWLVNTGTAGLYRPGVMKLRLSGSDDSCELTLAAHPQQWLIGDIVHNEMLRLPNLTAGRYRVHIGLFGSDRRVIPLGIEGQAEDGYYDAGTLTIADEADQLVNIWDTYYPEGYYPLEDPQVPTAEEVIGDAAGPQDIKGETH
ncbi:DUF4832 domain-containing protein [Paenibacillus daejeonensis]|uniref:DUF4832 domain-containing protein n=1 Tax=Paenibacillus daejeonensis TaxID=135193 RepID=UPI000380BD22|nr:DUF4832 domain-containing protein [Paenibacillus daejeonensis]